MFNGFFSREPAHKAIAKDVAKGLSGIGGEAVNDLVETLESNEEIVGELHISVPVITMELVFLFVFYAKNTFIDEFSEDELEEFISVLMYESLKNIKYNRKLIFDRSLIDLSKTFNGFLLSYNEDYQIDWRAASCWL